MVTKTITVTNCKECPYYKVGSTYSALEGLYADCTKCNEKKYRWMRIPIKTDGYGNITLVDDFPSWCPLPRDSSQMKQCWHCKDELAEGQEGIKTNVVKKQNGVVRDLSEPKLICSDCIDFSWGYFLIENRPKEPNTR